MAKAIKIDEVVELVVKEPASVQLTLTMDEASAILSLLGSCVAGGPTSGVYQALKDVAKAGYDITLHSGFDCGPIQFKKR